MQTHLGHIQFNVQPANLPFYKELMAFLGWQTIHAGDDMLGVGSPGGASLWFMGQLWSMGRVNEVRNDRDGLGMNHLALGTQSQADVDATVAYLTEHGVAPLFETPRHRPEFAQSDDHTYYQVMFESPDRILLEVVYTGPKTVYEAAGGIDGLRRLACAWHARVMADEVVSHAFSHGYHPEHTERLAAYWAETLGGSRTYSDTYGDETSVVRLHSGNGPHEEMDRRAIACFDQALVDTGLAGSDRLRQVLHDYFIWATTTMAHYHRSADDVPEGLPIPHWSWAGLVSPTGR